MLFLLVLVVLGLLTHWLLRIRRYPPGPFPLPVIGNLLQVQMHRIELQLAEWHQRYGPIYTIWMPQPVVIFADYEAITKYFIRQGDIFAGRPLQYVITRVYHGRYGLIREENDQYKEQRAFALHAFRDIGSGQSGIEVSNQEGHLVGVLGIADSLLEVFYQLQQTIVDLAYRVVCKLREHPGDAIELRPFVSVPVVDVVNRIAFGELGDDHDDEETVAFKKQLDFLVEGMFEPMNLAIDSMPWVRHLDFKGSLERLVTVNDKCFDYLQIKIDHTRANFVKGTEPACYADAFIAEQERRREKGESLGYFTDQQLLCAIYDLYQAGIETSLASIRYAFLFLMNNQHVQAKLHREIDERIGQREIQIEDSKRLHYMNAFIQEVHRVARIVPLNVYRSVLEDVHIEGGYVLPKDTVAVAQFPCIFQDETIYPRPDLFFPERHLNDAGEFVKDEKINPFSVGKRSCLGEALARSELFLILSILLQAFEFRPESVIPPPFLSNVSLVRQPLPYKCRLFARSQ